MDLSSILSCQHNLLTVELNNETTFTLHDGPPFATGNTHFGHIVASLIKDIVLRYYELNKYNVKFKYGWDCHGLPVEQKVGLKLNKSIAEYNDECKKVVNHYSHAWIDSFKMIGRKLNKTPYKTMDFQYMQSIWWAFSEIYKKGLIYHGYKVMLYSPQCGTSLSNAEGKSNYKKRQDPSIIIEFPLLNKKASMVIWTTTPWTLPFNMALCVNEAIEYVEISDDSMDKVYILAKDCIEYFETITKLKCKIINVIKGHDLIGLQYEPIYNYLPIGNYKVIHGDHVNTSVGTGVVHTAPAFGQDDLEAALDSNVIDEKTNLVTLEKYGEYPDTIKHLAGKFYLDCNQSIISNLKTKKKLIVSSSCHHDYPHCPRTDQPLIYMVSRAWMMKVSSIKDKLIETSKEINWINEKVKNRFDAWLRDAKDWNLERNRYWGTPIPLWTNKDSSKVICISSLDELYHYTSKMHLHDLHRQSVDSLTFQYQGETYERIDGVFDCWFESACMPSAQHNYPQDKSPDVEKYFQADFIAEGLDQTRGWFYTLHVVSTVLFEKSAFKNVIANGIVMAQDGKKMSKRLKNYPDPKIIIESYGADALRLYLMSSPVVTGEPLYFNENGVDKKYKDLTTLYNAFKFFLEHQYNYTKQSGETLPINLVSTDSFDTWILSTLESTRQNVGYHLNKYEIGKATNIVIEFIKDLTNGYVRMNRDRLKNTKDPRALVTLFWCLLRFSQISNVFIPFVSQYIYKNVINVVNEDFPEFIDSFPDEQFKMDKECEKKMKDMFTVIHSVRLIRDNLVKKKIMIPSKMPVTDIIINSDDSTFVKNIISTSKYIKKEVNVESIYFTKQINVKLNVQLDRKMGKTLRKNFKKVSDVVSMWNINEIEASIDGIECCGVKIFKKDLIIEYIPDKVENYESTMMYDNVLMLNTKIDKDNYSKWIKRLVINQINQMRKKASLHPWNKVKFYYNTSDSKFHEIIYKYKLSIESELKYSFEQIEQNNNDLSNIIISETNVIDMMEVTFYIYKSL